MLLVRRFRTSGDAAVHYSLPVTEQVLFRDIERSVVDAALDRWVSEHDDLELLNALNPPYMFASPGMCGPERCFRICRCFDRRSQARITLDLAGLRIAGRCECVRYPRSCFSRLELNEQSKKFLWDVYWMVYALKEV